jgi:phospholipid-binding lipoprotein MlaA
MRRILLLSGLVIILSLVLIGSGCSSKSNSAQTAEQPVEQVAQKPDSEAASTQAIQQESAEAAPAADSVDNSASPYQDSNQQEAETPLVSDSAEQPAEDDDSAIFMDDNDLGADGKEPWVISDPLEPWNRAVFEFNDVVYRYFLDPFVVAYTTVFPDEIRQLVTNFFYNLSTPVRFVSSVLQGKLEKTWWETSRFVVNSTVGFFGFADASTILGMPKPSPEDFGQVLGAWGIGHGPYVVWPLLGPQSVRDTTGLLAELVLVDPVVYFAQEPAVVWTYLGYKWFHRAAELTEDYYEMTDAAIDPYAAVRDFYSQYRWQLLND